MLVEAADRTEAMAGTERPAAAPLRRCIVTGNHGPRARLLRLVLSPDGVVTPDVAAKLPGRGAWLTPDRAVLAQAIKRKLFARAFHGAVTVPDDLAARIEKLLRQRAIDALSLARRAGQAVAGAEKVEAKVADWARKGRGGLLVLARDAGTDARRRWSTLPAEVTLIDVLDGAEIGQAFARERAAQAAVERGGLMERLIDDATRLADFRPQAEAAGQDANEHG